MDNKGNQEAIVEPNESELGSRAGKAVSASTALERILN
jgi:hypothetical protein